MGNCLDHRVRSATDHELLVGQQRGVQPPVSVSALAITALLQQASRAVPPPADANDVHQHVFHIWNAMREIMYTARICGHFKVVGDMWGAWNPSVGKTPSRIML